MSYSICRVEWNIAAPLLKNVRERVFICEWRIPKRIEFDQHDRQAFHILVCDDISQEPVATGRILTSGEISRIAVLMPYREQKIDKLIFNGLFQIARELQLSDVYINSPLESVDYFRQHNFHSIGAVFMEAGLPKQRMACAIEKISDAKYYLSH